VLRIQTGNNRVNGLNFNLWPLNVIRAGQIKLRLQFGGGEKAGLRCIVYTAREGQQFIIAINRVNAIDLRTHNSNTFGVLKIVNAYASVNLDSWDCVLFSH